MDEPIIYSDWQHQYLTFERGNNPFFLYTGGLLLQPTYKYSSLWWLQLTNFKEYYTLLHHLLLLVSFCSLQKILDQCLFSQKKVAVAKKK